MKLKHMGPEHDLLYQVEGVGGSATQLQVGATQCLAQCSQSWLPSRITWGPDKIALCLQARQLAESG